MASSSFRFGGTGSVFLVTQPDSIRRRSVYLRSVCCFVAQGAPQGLIVASQKLRGVSPAALEKASTLPVAKGLDPVWAPAKSMTESDTAAQAAPFSSWKRSSIVDVHQVGQALASVAFSGSFVR